MKFPSIKPVNRKNFAVLFFCVISVYFLIWSFTGQGILQTNIYNSFSLQADAWLHGRLDLGKDYPHLELAIFNGKYFVSFPPLPSVVMLPFVLIFGLNTPDNVINLIFTLISIFFAFRTAKNFYLSDESAVIVSLFYVLGSNMTFLMFRGWVWFLAQTMSFAFCTISVYYATTPKHKDTWLAFLFLAFAIGCRPFQVVYAFVTIFLVLLRYRMQNTGLKSSAFFAKVLPRLLLYAIPALLVGIFYAVLNYARFNNIFEFGHNYLPEFTRSPNGQFSFAYLSDNLASLIHIPAFTPKGLDYPTHTGFSIFMVNPIITIVLPLMLYRIIRKTKIKYYKAFILLCLLSISVHLFLICMHKTMGGWQFGNRYSVDCLPYVFVLFLSLADYDSNVFDKLCLPFFVFGLTINTIGTVMAYRM